MKKREAVTREKPGIWKRFWNRPDSSALIAVLLLIVMFAAFSDSFLSFNNIFSLLRNSSLYIFVALGQAMALVVGGMNIAIGATGALATVVCGVCFQTLGLPIWLTILLSLLAGALTGLVNGLIIIKVKLNAFVATLSTSFVYTGLANGISKGYPYTDIPEAFTKLGRGSLGPIPYLFLCAAAALVVMHIIFRYTLVGRKILATGGNKEAAQLSGIRSDNVILLTNIVSGALAALAALLWISRLGSATPATGADWMLISNAVAIIGGTALTGGVFTATGFLCSGIMLAIIKNGLIMMEVNIYYEQTFLGIVLLIAVALESVRMRYARKAK